MRMVYLAHSVRSDWNNGNAHFLRGLMRALAAQGHRVTVLEPEVSWSIENLRCEGRGSASLAGFAEQYPELNVQTYTEGESEEVWRERLAGAEIVVLHEWNPPWLAHCLLRLRDSLHFRLLFHDTHHRASSSPEQIRAFALERFDGILAFGEALRTVYREHLGMERVWTLHEAADDSIFSPRRCAPAETDVVWVGNWGEGERSREIHDFLLGPARRLRPGVHTTVYGVRYPEEGLQALRDAGVEYGGYLPNLEAPRVYGAASLTVHVPRQQYTTAMTGIPTIRVFEALACGIPLLSAPWEDTEGLFRPGDLRFVHHADEMTFAMKELLNDPAAAREQAACGLETVLARHTCAHRARELAAICEEVLQ